MQELRAALTALQQEKLQEKASVGGLTRQEYEQAEGPVPAQGGLVYGLVPTMGALHSGHAALVEAAREASDVVVASVFVNPLQFEDEDDYRHYPRQLDSDVELLRKHGVDLVFAPDTEEMYPGHSGSPDSAAPLVRVSAGELGRRWEGASRPGHFDGVVTVVNKLFNLMSPPWPARLEAWFGEKDAEQLAIITRMVADFNQPVTIRSLPIVRDESGLALSSRNLRLSEQDYSAALSLSQVLFTLRDRAAAGEALDVAGLRRTLSNTAGVNLDYLVVVDPETLRETEPGSGLLSAQEVLGAPALALIAARVGPVRLIDNMRLFPR